MTVDPNILEMAGRYADGGASADEVRTLESALRDDPALRRWFLRYLNVDSALGAVAGGQTEQPAADRGRWRIASWRGGAMVAAAAALILIAVGFWRVWPAADGIGGRRNTDQAVVPPTPSSPATAPSSPPPPVVLVSATQAQWADADVELSLRGGDLPAGLLRLDSGTAEFRSAAGATVVLLGPAAVRFPSPGHMFLQQGRALCRCPTPASRIVVTTPDTKVVDLGTEFAVDVRGGSAGTHVAVVSGSVRVGSAEPLVLRTGEAAEVGTDDVVRLSPLPADTLTALLSAAAGASASAGRTNLLADTQFTADAARGPWQRTEGHVDIVPGTSGGRAAAVASRGHRFWPGVRQILPTGDVAGRLVVASVDGSSPAGNPLEERQSAILKVVFLDAGGREFATASRHFLHVPAARATAELAAIAPAGTHAVQLQLLLNARGRPGGAVLFENPRLSVTPGEQIPTTRAKDPRP